MKDGLPESKRRNVATLIMMGNERKRERERYIHAKTGGPLSLLYATSMREEEMKKSSNRIFVYLSLCHILYICECSSCFISPHLPPPKANLFLSPTLHCSSRNLHYLFRYRFSSTHFHLESDNIMISV